MWFWLALVSAVLGAIDIILSKRVLNRVSPVTLSWAVYVISLPILVPLSLIEGIPSINTTFWLAVVLSSLTFVLARTIFLDVLKNNFVSDVMPVTAFSGVFIYLFGLVLLSETIRAVALIGMLLVLVGVYILNVEEAKEDILKPFRLLFSSRSSVLLLVALILGSLTVIFDKMGVINTSPVSPLFVILIESILMIFLLSFYLIKRESKTCIGQVRNNFRILFINSMVHLATAYVVYQAYALEGPAALVISIKRLQIFFALALGWLFLKDKPGKYTWIATAVMIAGVILIRME